MEQCKKNKRKDTGSGNGKSTKEESLLQFESELKILAKQIKEVGEKEIDLDLDDNENSPFEELGKLQKKFWGFWTKLCKHAGCNPLRTGRWVENKLKIRDRTLKDAYPHLVKKLEAYVNKKGFSYVPNFAEVRNIVLHEKHGIPGEADIDVDAVAKRLLEAVVNEARERRMRDSTSDHNDTSNDAADKDPLFIEKIRENQEFNAEALAELRTIVDRLIRSQDEQGESEEDGEVESGGHDSADTPKTLPTDILCDDDSDDDFKEAPPAKKLRR